MKKKQMCVAFHAYLSGVTHTRQDFTVLEIKSHFSIVCRFYLFSPFHYYVNTAARQWRRQQRWRQREALRWCTA